MKTTKKILSGVLALSLSISSPFIVYAKSAVRENVKTDLVQDKCLGDYWYSEFLIDAGKYIAKLTRNIINIIS